TIAVLAVGLSGVSVGLSAFLPNFRESDPSKIAVGFGGTLNLVAGLLFLGVTVALMPAPWHIYAAIQASREDLIGPPPWWLFAGVVPGLASGVLAAWLPLRAGTLALRRMEF